tara:strand:- start:280 stop:2916 length:2637 start_codon:yes stop_codon:yes gene_type:complete
MFKKILLYIVSLLILTFSILVHANSQTDSIEEVVVTGSYIKGSPTDGSSPVEILDRSEINAMGASTIADITANIAVNSGSENNADAFTQGSTQGTSNINLRGLGLSSTLVLVDGRRHTISGVTANDGSVFVNTASIPLVALDRVEVLKEGAASIYGSDAVAGVVNYIFRRDFEGFEAEISQQETDLASQKDRRASVIYGFEEEDTNFIVALSHLDRTPLAGSNFNPSLAPLGVSGLGTSFLLFGPSSVSSGPYAGTYSIYENVPDPNCEGNKGILIPQGSGQRCGFFYGGRFNIVNDEEHRSIYSSFQSQVSSNLTFNLDILSSQIEVKDNPQSPSYPALSYLSPSNAILPGKGGNPFGVPVLWIGRPLASAFPSPLAPRESETTRISFGLSGLFSNGFNWNLQLTNSSEKNYVEQPDTSTSRFSDAINGIGGVNGNETWSLVDPISNSQSLIDYISTSQKTYIETDLTVLDFLSTGQISSINLALGVQLREEEYVLSRDLNSIAEFDADGNITKPANLLFLGGGLESSKSRDTSAFFIEASYSPSESFELKGALRYEDLESDSSVNPKISLRYQSSDSLILRASLSTSFREASLAQLSSSNIGLQGIQDYDASGNAKGGTAFIRIAQKNNPDLKPEESDNLNMGVIWRPNNQLEIKLDYWAIDYKDVITIESAQGKVLTNPLGDPDVKRTTGGTLVGVTTNYFNAASVDTNGFDFEASYMIDSSMGELDFGLNIMHMLKYEIPAGSGSKDVVGQFNFDNFARSMPETKMVLSSILTKGNHILAGYGRFVSSYETSRPISASAASQGFTKNIDSFFTLDLQYNYLFDLSDYDMQFTLGVKNIFDEEAPRVYDAANWSYDSKHHDPRGRITFLGLKIMR